jgi:murein DD-endopeptidase MepM/ murein hydrolase activator NlpD
VASQPRKAPELSKQAAVAGWVIDGAGQPMVGVAIHRVGVDGSAGEQLATTEVDGAYRFKETPAPGDELILLGESVFPSTFRHVEEEKGTRVMGTRRMQIAARVLHAGEPVPGVTVSLSDGSGPQARTELSDEEGLVYFAGLVPGVYELSAHGRKLASAPVQASRLVDERAVVELALQEASAGEGRVLSAEGLGLQASVTLISLQGEQASRYFESDAEGRFSMAGLLPGRYQVRTHAPGYVSARETILEAGTDEVELAIRLQKGGVAQGLVVDSSGVPIANARVVLHGKSPARSKQEPSLATRWVHPLATTRAMPIRDSRRFGAARDGLRPAECGHGHCGVDIGTERGRVVHAAADARVARVIRDGQGKAGRYVVLEHQGGLSSFYMHLDEIEEQLAAGQWLRAGQPIGTIGRTGVIRSGAHLHFAISQQEGERSWFIDPEPILRHALVLPFPAELHPHGAASDTGLQVAQVLHEAGEGAPGSQSWQTDQSGRFRIEGLPSGNYRVSAFHADLAPGSSKSFALEHGTESSELVVRLQPGVEVYGVVQGPEGPIAGAKIVAEEGEGLSARSVGKTFADAEGRFQMRRLSGAIALRVSAPGYGVHQRRLKLGSNATSRREVFVLDIQNRQLRGQVRDPAGFPMPNASVRIVSGPSGRGRRASTDEYGHYFFDNLAAGSYRVDVLSTEYPTVTRKLRTEGSDEIRLEQGGAIALLLSDAHSRRALSGVRVEAFGPEGKRSSLVTDAEGKALFPALRVGSWKFRVRASGFVQLQRELVVRASEGSPAVEEIELYRGASLAGILRDANGDRAAGARVWVGNSSTTTDQDGRFRLDEVKTGEVFLEAEGGDAQGEQALTLAPGDELVTLDLRLQ